MRSTTANAPTRAAIVSPDEFLAPSGGIFSEHVEPTAALAGATGIDRSLVGDG